MLSAEQPVTSRYPSLLGSMWVDLVARSPAHMHGTGCAVHDPLAVVVWGCLRVVAYKIVAVVDAEWIDHAMKAVH